MDGITAARIVDSELASRGISKADFYVGSGISSATLSQWRTGKYDPTPDKLAKAEQYLGIKFADYENQTMDSETAELLEQIRSRPDLGVLLRSAKDVPPSSVYELVSKLEKLKEDAND